MIANLENLEQLSDCQFAVVQAGGRENLEDVLTAIRCQTGLSQVAAHVRNARRSSHTVEGAFIPIHPIIGTSEVPTMSTRLPSGVPG